MKLPIRVLLTAAMASASLVACTGKTVKPETGTHDQTTTGTTTSGTSDHGYKPADLDTDSCLRQRVVSFDFARSEIRGEFEAAVSCHAAYLKQFPGARVTLEGNADERGTREYNMGLGERRGNAVSSALGSAGASTSQLNTVSYGEERPVCKEHTEDCWQKNRRVEVVYTSKQ